MKQLAGASLCAAPLLGRYGAPNLLQPQIIAPPKPELPPPTYLTERDHAFLEDLEKASFQYFWDQADPKTGMVRDRCNVRASGAGVLGSTAATAISARMAAAAPMPIQRPRWPRLAGGGGTEMG